MSPTSSSAAGRCVRDGALTGFDFDAALRELVASARADGDRLAKRRGEARSPGAISSAATTDRRRLSAGSAQAVEERRPPAAVRRGMRRQHAIEARVAVHAADHVLDRRDQRHGRDRRRASRRPPSSRACVLRVLARAPPTTAAVTLTVAEMQPAKPSVRSPVRATSRNWGRRRSPRSRRARPHRRDRRNCPWRRASRSG